MYPGKSFNSLTGFTFFHSTGGRQPGVSKAPYMAAAGAIVSQTENSFWSTAYPSKLANERHNGNLVAYAKARCEKEKPFE